MANVVAAFISIMLAIWMLYKRKQYLDKGELDANESYMPEYVKHLKIGSICLILLGLLFFLELLGKLI